MPVFDINKFKAPRAIRLLSQHGINALIPLKVYGRWRNPLISSRIAANLRKRSIVEGSYGTFSPLFGGWDPAWDKQKKIHIIKPHKGHKRERTREARAAKITAAMTAMPERIRKYEQEIKDKKPKRDILSLFKRLESLSLTKSKTSRP